MFRIRNLSLVHVKCFEALFNLFFPLNDLDCKFEVQEKSGFIASPGYPEGYPSNINCTWDLKTTPGMVIQLMFVVTSIGTSSSCSADFVEVIVINYIHIL